MATEITTLKQLCDEPVQAMPAVVANAKDTCVTKTADAALLTTGVG